MQKEKGDVLVPFHFHSLLLLASASRPLHKPQAGNVQYQITGRQRLLAGRAKISSRTVVKFQSRTTDVKPLWHTGTESKSLKAGEKSVYQLVLQWCPKHTHSSDYLSASHPLFVCFWGYCPTPQLLWKQKHLFPCKPCIWPFPALC